MTLSSVFVFSVFATLPVVVSCSSGVKSIVDIILASKKGSVVLADSKSGSKDQNVTAVRVSKRKT